MSAFATLTGMRRQALLAATISGLCVLSPAVAGAQTPGLHVDPDSPTGHEYAIPLDQARGSASPGSQSSGGSAGSGSQAAAPRFGVGVAAGGGSGHSGSGGSGSGGSGSGGSGSNGGSGSGGASGGASHAGGSAARTVSALGVRLDSATANPASSIGTSLLVGGIAAAVLVLGAVAGLMARRGRTTARES